MRNRMWETSQDFDVQSELPQPRRTPKPKKDWVDSLFKGFRILLDFCAGVTLYILMVGGLGFLIKHNIIRISKTPWAESILYIGIGVIWYHAYKAIQNHKI